MPNHLSTSLWLTAMWLIAGTWHLSCWGCTQRRKWHLSCWKAASYQRRGDEAMHVVGDASLIPVELLETSRRVQSVFWSMLGTHAQRYVMRRDHSGTQQRTRRFIDGAAKLTLIAAIENAIIAPLFFPGPPDIYNACAMQLPRGWHPVPHYTCFTSLYCTA